jgi:CRP/FNR family cyclic AMP-dependent transcriptional regulator
MIHRFEGTNGQRLLVDALLSQKVVRGNQALAKEIAEKATLRAVAATERLIVQEATDNDIYLILHGTFAISVNGQKVGERAVNDTVGEMAAMDPALPRSATVVAETDAVVACLSEADFSDMASRYNECYRYVAQVLAQRLRERNKLVKPVHEKIRVFLISSVESLPIARAIHTALSYDPFDVIPWNEGVFRATQYTLKTLEEEVEKADFAVAIAHADDITHYKDNDWPTPRDNVIFELGLFMGRLGSNRAILFEPRNNKVRLPSDVAGVTTITYPYTKGDPDFAAHMAPACNQLRTYISTVGARKER